MIADYDPGEIEVVSAIEVVEFVGAAAVAAGDHGRQDR